MPREIAGLRVQADRVDDVGAEQPHREAAKNSTTAYVRRQQLGEVDPDQLAGVARAGA
jgi:hypothetical protein